MKNRPTLLIILLGALLAAPVLAQDDATPVPAPSKWYLGIGLGVTCPVQDWDPNYPLGGQGLLMAGYPLNNALALQFSSNTFFLTGKGLSTLDERISLELRWRNLTEGRVHPYILAGPGFDIQTVSPLGYNTSTPAAVFGIGFEFDLRPGEHLLLESRYDILFYKNLSQQDIPLTLALSEDL